MKSFFLFFNLVLFLCLMLTSSSYSQEKSQAMRNKDGRAYRIDKQGVKIIDEMAELQATVEEQKQQIYGLENQLKHKDQLLEDTKLGKQSQIEETSLFKSGNKAGVVRELSKGNKDIPNCNDLVSSIQLKLSKCEHDARNSLNAQECDYQSDRNPLFSEVTRLSEELKKRPTEESFQQEQRKRYEAEKKLVQVEQSLKLEMEKLQKLAGARLNKEHDLVRVNKEIEASKNANSLLNKELEEKVASLKVELSRTKSELVSKEQELQREKSSFFESLALARDEKVKLEKQIETAAADEKQRRADYERLSGDLAQAKAEFVQCKKNESSPSVLSSQDSKNCKLLSDKFSKTSKELLSCGKRIDDFTASEKQKEHEKQMLLTSLEVMKRENELIRQENQKNLQRAELYGQRAALSIGKNKSHDFKKPINGKEEIFVKKGSGMRSLEQGLLEEVEIKVAHRKNLLDQMKSQGRNISLKPQPLISKSGKSLDILRAEIKKGNIEGAKLSLIEISKILDDDIAVLGRLSHRY